MRGRSLGRLLLVVSLAVVGIVPPSGVAGAEPPPGLDGAAATAGKPESWVVTVVTGDRFALTRQADGSQTAALLHRSPAGRSGYLQMRRGENLVVIPRAVAPLVGTVLDRDLFDLTRLVSEGYDDARRSTLPLLVEQSGGVSPRALTQSYRGMAPRAALSTIRMVGVRLDKKATGSLTDRLVRTSDATARATAAGARVSAASRLPGGISRVWLDGRVRATALDWNLTAIGAPAAWAAGHTGAGVKVAVLDTGIDAEHPDLAGRVVGAKNFSEADGVDDHMGHGTHVAGTVAGTGAAAGGARKGVAFGARLLNGKVLDDGGGGYESDIIAGMEWAAAQGAKVVNMSLGSSQPSDGTDPMAMAVNSITAQKGVLFVVSAGNNGPWPTTLGTPGVADAALTVGATDSRDQLADFSSRGPRIDGALKPDITAPGVDTIAPRAGGTELGEPVGTQYVKLSGTSMAAPHVAGAAAVLAAVHPTWTPAQLKTALVSTADPQPKASVYEQGGGRLDLAQGVVETVQPAVHQLAVAMPYPQKPSDTVTRSLSWTNTGTTAVTLDLSTGLSSDGRSVPGAARLSASSLTIAPGSTGAVSVAVVVSKLSGYGGFGGYVTAAVRGTTRVVRTPLGVHKEAPHHVLTVKATTHSGAPAGQYSAAVLQALADSEGASVGEGPVLRFDRGVAKVRIADGSYLAAGFLTVERPDGGIDENTLTMLPQLTIDRDMTVRLDGRAGRPVGYTLQGRTVAPSSWSVTVEREVPSFSSSFSIFGTGPLTTYLSPVPRPSTGTVTAAVSEELAAPALTIRSADLSAPVVPNVFAAPRGSTTAELKVVRSLGGMAAASGKVALVRRGTAPTGDLLRAARRAGVRLLVIGNDRPYPWQPNFDDVGDMAVPPFATVDSTAYSALRALGDGALLHLKTSASSTPSWLVGRVWKGQVDPHPTTMTAAEVARMPRIDTAYHGRPDQTLYAAYALQLTDWTSVFIQGRPAPARTTTYVLPDVPVLAFADYLAEPSDGSWSGLFYIPQATRYAPGQRVLKRYNAQPHTTAGMGVRFGRYMLAAADLVVDGDGNLAFATAPGAGRLRLWHGDKLLGDSEGMYLEQEVGTAAGRFTLRYDGSAPELASDATTRAIWRFSSRPPSGREDDELALLNVSYRLPLDLSGHLLPGTMQVRVRDASGAPATLREERSSYSLDGGRTWRSLERTAGGYAVPVVPAGATLSLRTWAADTTGSSVSWRILGAVG